MLGSVVRIGPKIHACLDIVVAIRGVARKTRLDVCSMLFVFTLLSEGEIASDISLYYPVPACTNYPVLTVISLRVTSVRCLQRTSNAFLRRVRIQTVLCVLAFSNLVEAGFSHKTLSNARSR
jgi:hypothetical protein